LLKCWLTALSQWLNIHPTILRLKVEGLLLPPGERKQQKCVNIVFLRKDAHYFAGAIENG
jgi:hypothetical protein